MDKENIKVRVIKGNWRTNEILYLSEPLTVEEAFQKERELVSSLAPRGRKRGVFNLYELCMSIVMLVIIRLLSYYIKIIARKYYVIIWLQKN